MIKDIIIDFLKENKVNYILYCITLLYIPVSKVGMPHLYGKLIGSLNDFDINITIKFLIMLIFLWFLIQVVHSISNMYYSRILPKFNSYTRTRIINEIINRHQENFKDLMVGDTITKLIKAPWVLEDIFSEIETFIFNNSLVTISSFFYLFYYNKPLGLIYAVSMIIIIFICFSFSKSCVEIVEKSEKIYDGSYEEIEDMLSNLISVYTSQRNTFEQKRFNYLSKGIYKSEQQNYKCYNKYRLIYSTVFVIIFAILNIYSIKIYFDKKIKLETLSAIIIINYSLLSSFMTIYYQTRRFIDLKGRLSVLKTYLDNLPEYNNSSTLEIDYNEDINISINNLGFYYIPNKYIIKDITLNIKQNEKIAIMGEIGSGKSTIGKLLIKLFSYDEGSIKINNKELSNINVKSIRNVITYIPQHPKLFNRSLFSNLTYGNKHVSRKTLIETINSIKIKSIRNLFLETLDKSVGKYGNNLSGGQRQIVWLIRAMFRDSKIIILDEPTSSLDEKNKNIVIEFIKQISKNKTLIIITHDKSLLKYVNRKITLNAGKLISDKQIKKID